MGKTEAQHRHWANAQLTSANGTFRTSHLHRRTSAVGGKLAPHRLALVKSAPAKSAQQAIWVYLKSTRPNGRRVRTKSHRSRRSLDVLVGFQREHAVLFACKSHPARLPKPIDIWPDHVAVSPLLIARRTFRPSQTSTNMLKTARLLGLEWNLQ
jgi:hypothetical protein